MGFEVDLPSPHALRGACRPEPAVQDMEALDLVQGWPTTRYYWFSDGEPGDEEGFLVTVTDRGRKSYELAKAAGL